MASFDDVRRIARELPGTSVRDDQRGMGVEGKGKKQRGFVWAWNERVDPKKARVPNFGVIAIRVANETEKATLLSADTDKFFTEPHYDGYPAVLVRLANVTADELRMLLTEAWRCMAAPHIVTKLDGDRRAAARRASTKPAPAKRASAKRASAKRAPTKPTSTKPAPAKRASAKPASAKRR
jgi:hypothetical protein